MRGGKVGTTWGTRYRVALLLTDLAAFFIAALAATAVRFGTVGATEAANRLYWPWILASAPLWPLLLNAARAYDLRLIGAGGDEYRCVVIAGTRLLTAFALLSYVLKADVSRTLVLIAVPGATLLTLAGRFAARVLLARLRERGRWLHRVMLIGAPAEIARVAETLGRNPYAGLVPVARYPVAASAHPFAVGPVTEAVRAEAVDTVIVAGDGVLGADGIRRLSWALENTGVSLFAAPALTELTSPRLTVRPLDDVVLLHIAAPTLSGYKQLIKRGFDVVAAAIGLLLAAPVLVPLGVIIRLSSPGPALFRQTRIGRNGEPFTCLKLRSMYQDAEARRPELEPALDSNAVLFKLRDDPRVTRIGRIIRRYSLDELPQLINVLTGSMSLVGPRPPLPSEVDRYSDDTRRRLLVRPGMTGLWQVSGRSDLPWERAVQLDLHYVANWSLTLDLHILTRTVKAVLSGNGAY